MKTSVVEIFMRSLKSALVALLFVFSMGSCGYEHSKQPITRIEMNLSALGVESAGFPSIDANIDFVNGSGKCAKSYYDPQFKPSSYTLSVEEMKKISALLNGFDLRKLKAEYSVAATDQPTSTTIIYLGERKFVIKDYGLVGGYILQDLYKIVYKLETDAAAK